MFVGSFAPGESIDGRVEDRLSDNLDHLHLPGLLLPEQIVQLLPTSGGEMFLDEVLPDLKRFPGIGRMLINSSLGTM